MQNSKMSRDEFLMMFREDVIILSKYIPWFEVKKGEDVSKNYVDGERMNSTLTFPVYDTILLSFLNEASMTVFMERNYRYFYTRNQIMSARDELKAIERADIMHMDILQCILSKYVMGGMTKAYLWKDGVDNGVFLAILKKAKEIIEFWELPLYIADEIVPEEDEPSFEIQTVDVTSSNVRSSIDLSEGADDDWSDEDIARILAGLDDDVPEKMPAETPAEETTEEIVEEVVEAPVEAAPAADDEWSDEDIARILAEAEADEQAAAETPAEETTEEIVEEPVEEAAEEVVEETAEEATEEIVEEPVEEATEEIVEETVEEITEEVVEETAEAIVADNETMPTINRKNKRDKGRNTNKRRANN